MKVIYQALKFAEEKHRGQVRKASNDEYITHPILVSYLACSHKKSKNLPVLIAASILHDTVEDTDASYDEILKEFGPFVSSLVHELTDNADEIKRIGKLEYQKTKWPGLSNYGLFLKLCDRLANVSDNPKQKYLDDTLEILDNLKKKRRLTKSQKSVVKEILKVIQEEKK